ncbi:metallophosphoesterase [Variovorax sp. LT2P21]|uniref:metallophosphoesterase n=1 Tax=Variovorax sp. LT2P21 TaxID=3443731 RepID=UPI003F451E60
MFGDPTWYSGPTAHSFSKVAIRSVEQDLFTKYVVQQVIDTIESSIRPGDPQPTLLHLGDLLDYGCISEWEKLMQLRWMHSKSLFIAPGNHDVVFQGNGSYLGWFGKLFLQMKGVEDSSLDSHHNAVCNRGRHHVPVLSAQSEDLISPLRSLPRYANNQRQRGVATSIRQLPNKFRCSYLRLKLEGVPWPNSELQRYCEDTVYFSRYEASGTEGGVAHQPDPDLDRTNLSWTIGMRAGGQFNNWDSGYLVQAVPSLVIDSSSGAEIGQIATILLDTTDWPKIPSFTVFGPADAGHSGLHAAQRVQVEKWLQALGDNPRIKAIFLAGHYPLKDFSRESRAWLEGLTHYKSVVPLYLSAHTHTGYVDEATWFGTEVRMGEINVGSLTDHPVHYRRMDLEWSAEGDRLRVNTVRIDPADQCMVAGPLKDAFDQGFKSASEFNGAMQPGWNKDEQWAERARYAASALAPFGGDRGSVTRQGKTFSADAVIAAEDRMMDALAKPNATALRAQAACQALGGAKAFDFTEANPPNEKSLQFKRDGGLWRPV